LGRNRTLERQQLKQLFATKYGSAFAVMAQLADGSKAQLVAPLVSKEQALFVEQQLEGSLGLVDFAVAGELGSAEPMSLAGPPVSGAKPGAALALLVPLLIGASLLVFSLATSTEVTGVLEASGKLGTWVFTPDDCVSGQREGFGGVVLTSKAAPERVVRVVKDPVKGALLVIAERTGANHVFEPSACESLDLVAQRTDTNINDIWAVDGRARVECLGLSGTVTFEGCH
jgi:hypothetical protein